jgi:hypothetical protein
VLAGTAGLAERGGAVLASSFVEQHHCLSVVLLDALAIVIMFSQVEL